MRFRGIVCRNWDICSRLLQSRVTSLLSAQRLVLIRVKRTVGRVDPAIDRSSSEIKLFPTQFRLHIEA